MPIINLFLAALVAFLTYLGWSDPYLSIIVGWFAFRVETLLSVQIASAGMTRALLEADNLRMKMMLGEYEQAVSEIARNN